jgi:8-oxo-dGTP diphosphatase
MQHLVVTAAVIRNDDSVLITRRPEGKPHAGMWEFPGGKLDGNESPRDCLRREVLEELGLEVAVGDIIETAYYRYDWGPVLVLAFECHPLESLKVFPCQPFSTCGLALATSTRSVPANAHLSIALTPRAFCSKSVDKPSRIRTLFL